jgi:glycosyltransferase involved in cell wall biosynthesis
VLNNFLNDSRVLKEAVTLQHDGYDVKVVALHEGQLREHDAVEGISVHRIKLKSRDWPKQKPVQLLKYLEFIYRASMLCRDADILHCNDLNTLPVGVIIKKFFNKNVKIVYDAHEFEINDKPNQSKLSIKLHYILEKSLIKYTDRVITVSNSIADEYVKLYGIEKPALVLNTPPYQEIEKKDIFREIFGISKDKTIFLYQGSLSEGRGIEVLLETFQQFDNNKNAIVFMGYGLLESLIQDAVKFHENIYFHKAVDPKILLDYTSSADFGISTIEDTCLSYRYCLPNKMFECLMADIPVIVSNLYEMERLVKNNGIGVVAKGNNSRELNKAIRKAVVLDKEQLRENIQKVKKTYSWEEQEKVLLNVYEELK